MAPKWGFTVARIEDLLRQEFRGDVPAGPGPDAMLARVAKARRRRAAGAVAGCAAILGGLALAAVSVIPPGLTGAPGAGEQPAHVYHGQVINTVFTDQRHGYVVQQGCSLDNVTRVPEGAPTPDVHERCQTQLLVTEDGGLTWRTRALPGDPATKDAGVPLVQGHSLMLWVDGTGRLAFGGWDRRYWTTADGAVTWQESATPREVGPAGSMGVFTADDRLTFLTSPPPEGIPAKKAQPDPAVPATDGSFWTACATGPCVRVTRDHGATWPAMSTVDSATSVDWVATYDGRTAYASVRTPGGYRLVRTSDGGVSWSDVLGMPQPSAGAAALPDGDLLLVRASEEGGMYRLRAGGSTLEPVADAPAHAGPMYVSGGVLVAAQAWQESDRPDLGSMVCVSADGGATWTAVPAPVD